MTRDADEFDFFVSYCRADNANGWITQFVDDLLVENRVFAGSDLVRYFFDKSDIHSFDDWQHRLNCGLAKSRLFLAFISPKYFASEWCRKEWKAWIDTEDCQTYSRRRSSLRSILWQFRDFTESLRLEKKKLQDRWPNCVTSRHLMTTLSVRYRRSYGLTLRRRQINEVQPSFQKQGLDGLKRAKTCVEPFPNSLTILRSRIGQVRQAAESESSVPPYNKQFTGRLNELMELRQRLKDDHAGVICGINGLGGIGKTELAFTYAHAFASEYPGGRFLIPCEGKSSLREAALHLGDLFREQIRDDERKTAETYFGAIREFFRERLQKFGHILLVLDNVSNANVVAPRETDMLTMLGPKLHLLATTRLPRPSSGAWMTLGELPDSDALELMERYRPFDTFEERTPYAIDSPAYQPAGQEGAASERVAARRIAKRLGGFSLVVELVAAWMAAHPEVTYASFLERLGLEDLEALKDAEHDSDIVLRRHNHERRIEAVLNPTLATLEPVERRFLEYAALLPPDLVALPWLQELLGNDFPELNERRAGYPDLWSNVNRRMVRLAIISRSDGDASDLRLVRVHRLVQDLVKKYLSADDMQVHAAQRLVSWRCLEPLHCTKPLAGKMRDDGTGILSTHLLEPGSRRTPLEPTW